MTRVVQVGMGGFGRNWAKEMIPQVTEVDLVACADPVPAARDAAVKQGIIAADRCYATAEEAIAATDPDAVLVTASLVGHVPAVRAALDAGRHVLVEKPFAPTVAEGRALVEQAEKSGLTLMVSQNYRFFPAPRAVQALVADGSLGEPHAVGIDFRRFSGAGGRRGAHHLLDEPLLVDMSIHHFDLMRAVLGRDALAVSAHTNNPKWTLFDGPPEGSAMIEFPDDLTVSYRGSWVSHGPPTAWAGEWRMDFEHGEVWWTSRGDGLDGRAAQESDEVWVRRDGRRRQIDLPSVTRTDRAGSLTEFVAAIRDGRAPESSGRDNLPSIGLTYAAVAAAASGLRTEV